MTSDWDDSTSVAGAPPAERAERRASLVVLRGANAGEVYPLTAAELVIGRGAGADVRINDEGVSRFHCKLRVDGEVVVVEDLASRNGTYCNGEAVVGAPRVLVDGDRVELGTITALRFIVAEHFDTGLADPVGEPLDPVTGAHGRAYFVAQLDGDVRVALRNRSPLSLVLMHIDRFADAIGRDADPEVGDQVLARFAAHVRDTIRREDVLARFSGEEFAVISRGGSSADTFMLAQRLRASTAALPIPTDAGPRSITVSIGVATVDELRIEAPSDLRLAAEAALQRARGMGGDRVVLCTPEIVLDRTAQRPRR